MRIYLAGPMRGKPEFNYPAFDRASEWLRKYGHTVYSPAEKDRDEGLQGDRLPDPEKLAELFKEDLRLVIYVVDAVVLLDDWEKSRGAQIERAVAEMTGKRVFRIHGVTRRRGSMWLEEVTDHAWLNAPVTRPTAVAT